MLLLVRIWELQSIPVGANSAFIYSNSGSGVSLGVLKKKVDDGTYYVENTYKNMPAISVTYKDK